MNLKFVYQNGSPYGQGTDAPEQGAGRTEQGAGSGNPGASGGGGDITRANTTNDQHQLSPHPRRICLPIARNYRPPVFWSVTPPTFPAVHRSKRESQLS